MKKGFTLMELMVVLAIMSIIYGITYINISSFKKLENKIDYQNTNNLLISFMNNSRLKCKSMRKSGYIYVDYVENILDFRVDGIITDKFNFPKGFKINSFNVPNGNHISINSFGYSYDAGTFIYIDREGIQHIITMTVGQDYAEIKN